MLKLIFLALLAGDCFLNAVISIGRPGFSTSWKRTLSATAWSVRDHKWVGWVHVGIDIGAFIIVGQLHHTQKAYENEQASGNVWARVFG